MIDMMRRLSEDGWAHYKAQGSEGIWDTLRELGDVFYVTDIRLDSESNQYAHRPQVFPMHTDAYDARFVAWFVVNSDSRSCPMRIADVSGFESRLSAEDISLLSDVEITYYERLTQSLARAPLIYMNERRRLSFNYFPTNFTLIRPESIAQRAALVRFREVVSSLPVQEIDLDDEDILILDNHRMIHGRGAMNASSSRWLRRAWINCDGKYTKALAVA